MPVHPDAGMLAEQPGLFYLNCRATGNTTDLANAMHKALNETSSP